MVQEFQLPEQVELVTHIHMTQPLAPQALQVLAEL